MTYRELCRGLVPLYGEGEARAVVDLLLEDGFSLTRADVLCGAVEQMNEADSRRLEAMYERLLKAEPVQYVTGKAMFMDRLFAVRKGVLIPRPETEQLCDGIIKEMNGRPAPHILDIGTGSGCIAISLALGIKDARVEAWDISPEALDVARGNAERLGAEVNIIRCDALKAPSDTRRWDVIVSNPPYICDRERQEMDRNVLDYEPGLALFVPDGDPLLFYRAISSYARESLKQGGSLWFEVNSLYSEDTAELLRSLDFTRVSVMEDCFGRPRFVRGERV